MLTSEVPRWGTSFAAEADSMLLGLVAVVDVVVVVVWHHPEK